MGNPGVDDLNNDPDYNPAADPERADRGSGTHLISSVRPLQIIQHAVTELSLRSQGGRGRRVRRSTIR